MGGSGSTGGRWGDKTRFVGSLLQPLGDRNLPGITARKIKFPEFTSSGYWIPFFFAPKSLSQHRSRANSLDGDVISARNCLCPYWCILWLWETRGAFSGNVSPTHQLCMKVLPPFPSCSSAPPSTEDFPAPSHHGHCPLQAGLSALPHCQVRFFSSKIPFSFFYCNHSISAPLLNPLFPVFPRTWRYSGRTKLQKNLPFN